jgi:hypothetical protein
MPHLVHGRFLENLGNVVVAFLACRLGKKGVLVAGLGFTGEGRFQILGGLTHFFLLFS